MNYHETIVIWPRFGEKWITPITFSWEKEQRGFVKLILNKHAIIFKKMFCHLFSRSKSVCFNQHLIWHLNCKIRSRCEMTGALLCFCRCCTHWNEHFKLSTLWTLLKITVFSNVLNLGCRRKLMKKKMVGESSIQTKPMTVF